MIAGLEYLSIQRVSGNRQPRVPSNTERMQAFRALQPVEFANVRFLSEGDLYAAQETQDGRYPTTETYFQE